MLVAEQVEERVHERLPPGRADDLGTDDRVAQLAWQAGRKLLAPVDRKGQDIGRLVQPEVFALQLAHLVRPDEDETEIAFVYSLGRQYPAREVGRFLFLDLRPAAVCDLDGDHAYLRRCVPVSSACLR